MVTSDECTDFFPLNMNIFCKDSREAVEFANDMLMSLEPGLPLTITITRARYADFYAVTAICESSGDIVTQVFSETQQNILSKDTPDGSSQ